MVRAFTAAAMALMTASCAPERAPANHRTWRLTFDAARASGCVQNLDAGLTLETWVPRTDVNLVRFVNSPVLTLNRALPFTFPQGLRGSDSRFDWSFVTNGHFGEQIGRHSQRLVLELFSGDAGVEGEMVIESSYLCSMNCDPPSPYGGCTSRLPFKLTEIDEAPFPIDVGAVPLDGGTMMTVALGTTGTCGKALGINAMRFERWSFSDSVVRIPAGSSHSDTWVNGKFGGELTRGTSSWLWLSDVDPAALPRAMISLDAFAFRDHEAFETVLETSVFSTCRTESCAPRACSQRTTVFAMQEEKPRP